MVVASATPLFADEAYYWHWSQSLRLGYPDHPPGVAALISIFGHPRLASVAITPLIALVLADAARRAGVARWRWTPALLLGTPLGFSLFIATPDGPLVLGWAVVVHGVVRQRGAVAGLGLAMALWSKSSALVGIPGLLWALGPKRGARAIAVAGLLYSPHLWWSVHHHGWPWTFQAGLRAWGRFALPEAIGGQLLVVTPWLAWLIIKAWRASSTSVERRLARLGWPVLLAWMGLSVVVRVEANWSAIAWLPGLVLVLGRPDGARGARRWAAGLTVVAALSVMGLTRWLPMGWGPPRDGAALRACLNERLGGADLVTGRYQERALLWSAGYVSMHQPSPGHRASWYGESPPFGGGCGYVFLGDEAHTICAGAKKQSAACGLVITECRCEGDR